MAEKAKNKKNKKCPPIPEGWTWKFTGPEWKPGMSVEEAKRLWESYRSSVGRLRQMPSAKKK